MFPTPYTLHPTPSEASDLSIPSQLAFWASSRPESPAIVTPGRPTLTYGRLWRQVEEVVKALNTAGIGRHDRVAMVLPDGPEMVTAFLSVSSAAGVAPLNPKYRGEEFDFYLQDLKPKALLVLSGFNTDATSVAGKYGIPVISIKPVPQAETGVFVLDSLAGSPAGDGGLAGSGNVALLLHTSGTTSRPKLVPLAQSNLCVSARNIAATLRLTEKDRCLNVMPLFHIHGIVGAVLSSLMAGGSVICDAEFRAENFFAALRKYQPTWYTAVPTIHQAILSYMAGNRIDVGSSLRFIRSSSAALPQSIMEKLEQVFRVPVIEAYGMTEAAHQMASNPLPPQPRKPASVGWAAGPEVGIMDEKGALLPPTEIGEIVIRGENVTAGYLDNPEANSQSFTGGWFRTGDQGYLDKDGYLFITGRLKEMINRGGEKIAPREIDEVLLEHPAVAQAVTFAVPHETLGEDIAAAVVLASGQSITEEEIQRFVAGRVAEFKAPQQIIVVDEIPKGPTGKIQRIGLAEKLSDKLRARFVAPRTAIERTLANIWSEVLALEEIGIHDNFFALGGDSLSAARVFNRMETAYGKRLPLSTLFEAPTIERLAAILDDNKSLPTTSCLVPIQPRGSRPPFFCIHNPGGQVINYKQLAHHLGADQPFYGIQAQGLDGKQPMHTTVEEMAAHYMKEIQTFQPNGPYFLGGFCFGGQIAFEIARRLHAQGEKVALLALFEAFVRRYPPSMAPKNSSAVKLLPRLSQRAIFHTRRLRKMQFKERLSYLLKRGSNAKILMHLALLRGLGGFCETLGLSLPRALQLRDVTLIHYQAGRTYVPQAYPGNAVLFLSQEMLESSAENPSIGWRRLVGGDLEVHKLECDHDDILLEPAVRSLAQTLRGCIVNSH